MASALFVAVRSDSASPLLQAQTFCLALRDRAGRQFLDRSHATTWVLHRPIVAMHECPRTYASMFVRVDKQGRPMDPKPPKGHVDPHRITVGVPTTDSLGWTVRVEFGHGMASWEKTCRALREGSVKCQAGLHRVSEHRGITGVAADAA